MNGTAINDDLIYVYILFYLLFTQYGYSNFKTEKVTKQYNHLSSQKQAKPLTKFYPISIFSPISNQAHKIIIFPIPQILNYQESIKNLKQEIFMSDQTYFTKLGIAFVTSSEFSFKSLKPTQLPDGNLALDVYLLRNQEVLITKNYQDQDELRNMIFPGFSNLLHRTFGQTLVPSRQDYNQVLTLESKVFKFAPLSSPLSYAVNTTSQVMQVFELVSQIIEKEQEILDQLLAFTDMLVQTSVFTAGDTLANPQDESLTQARLIRDISAFFSPYSLSELGQTASKNYVKMNSNFHKIGVEERRLSHDQNILAMKFSEITAVEKTLLRKSLFIEFRSFTQSHYQDFMFKLSQIFQHTKLHESYHILFSLLRDTQFCKLSICYSNPIFSVISAGTISASFTTSKQSLAKAVYVSCTILSTHRTSIYSHNVAILNPEGVLHFQQENLPSLKLQDLVNPKMVETQTRTLLPSDFVSEQLYPIYSNDKISLHCLEPKIIQIDSQDVYCAVNNLNFRPMPTNIIINDKIILAATIPQHLANKLDFINDDLRAISVFTPKNTTKLHFGEQIKGFFLNATPLHFSFITIILVSFVFMLFIMICLCYFKLPKLLFRLLCCCSANHFCKRKLQARILDVNQLITYRDLIRNGQDELFLPGAPPPSNPPVNPPQTIRPQCPDPQILVRAPPPPYNLSY